MRNLIVKAINQTSHNRSLSTSFLNSSGTSAHFAKPIVFQGVSPHNPPIPFSALKYYDPVHLSENRIVQGFGHLAVVYRQKLYFFAQLETLRQFLMYPLIYSKMKLPRKLSRPYTERADTENQPPATEGPGGSRAAKQRRSLTMSASEVKSNLMASVSQILGNICNKKEKFPFVSARESALKLLALELAIKNPQVDETFREVLVEKRKEFGEASKLMSRLKELYKTKEKWSEIDFEEFVRKVRELTQYQKQTDIFNKRDFFDGFLQKCQL